jgi:hypothetical protein
MTWDDTPELGEMEWEKHASLTEEDLYEAENEVNVFPDSEQNSKRPSLDLSGLCPTLSPLGLPSCIPLPDGCGLIRCITGRASHENGDGGVGGGHALELTLRVQLRLLQERCSRTHY